MSIVKIKRKRMKIFFEIKLCIEQSYCVKKEIVPTDASVLITHRITAVINSLSIKCHHRK